MYIDCHTHLDFFEDNIDKAIEEINNNEILTLANSMDIESYIKNKEYSKKSKFIKPCFGIHPWKAAEYTGDLQELISYIEESEIIGEIGLDYLWVEDKNTFEPQRKVFNFILLSMMVPFAALMVPLFRLFSKFNSIGPLKGISINTNGSVIIISIATAFLIFFFRQNTKSFPKDLIEAARIDGLSEVGIFFKIYMPTMKSTYAAATIVTFMASWNSYLWPLIALQSPEKRTLPLVISALGSSYTPDYGIIMTAVVIATLPTAIIFFLMQKHFVAGMTGSVKG